MDISLAIFLGLLIPFTIFVVIEEVKGLIDYYFDKKLEYETRLRYHSHEEEK